MCLEELKFVAIWMSESGLLEVHQYFTFKNCRIHPGNQQFALKKYFTPTPKASPLAQLSMFLAQTTRIVLGWSRGLEQLL